MKSKDKNKKGFFKKPFTISLTALGVGVGLTVGGSEIYDYLKNEYLIFLIELAKYLVYAIGIIYGSIEVKNISDNNKLGKELKEIVDKNVKKYKDKNDFTITNSVNLENHIKREVFKKLKKIIKK